MNKQMCKSKILLLSVLILVLVSGVLAGCTSSISTSVSVPEVMVPEGVEPVEDLHGAEIYLESVLDARKSKTVATLKGKNSQFIGDTTEALRSVLEESFAKKGFAFSDTAPVLITVELVKWAADIQEDYPAKVVAQAEVQIDVVGPANRKIYSGTYEGFANLEGGTLDDEKLNNLLKASMYEAIKQLIFDDGLINIISAF